MICTRCKTCQSDGRALLQFVGAAVETHRADVCRVCFEKAVEFINGDADAPAEVTRRTISKIDSVVTDKLDVVLLLEYPDDQDREELRSIDLAPFQRRGGPLSTDVDEPGRVTGRILWAKKATRYGRPCLLLKARFSDNRRGENCFHEASTNALAWSLVFDPKAGELIRVHAERRVFASSPRKPAATS